MTDIIDGWDVRSIYESPKTDLMESEAFYLAFARLHNIDGHHVLCIMTPAKYHYQRADGITTRQTILIVRDSELEGVSLNTSLRIDGRLYVISGITRPCGDIVRIELEGNE